MKPETRIVASSSSLEPPNRLVGYAAKFNEPSSVLWDAEVCKGPFVEIIHPGAFSNSLRDHPDVRALYNHSSGAVLGRTKAGTLALAEDDIGLRFDVTLPDTSVARDLRSSIARGDIDGCSFGFFVVEDRLEPRPGRPTIRHLIQCHVYEITPATAFPAYHATEVALRSRRPSEVPAPAPGPAPTPLLALARFRLKCL